MRASKFTEFVALVGLVVGCVIMMNARGGLFYRKRAANPPLSAAG